jgi:hypothetical protein
MEGITPTMALSFVACVTLGTAALVLFLVAGGLFFSGRPALRLFATAMLCVMASASFMGLAEASEGRQWSLRHLFALCLFLAAIGQCVTAFRNPRRYPTSLACAIGASALALGPLTSIYLHTWLRALLVIAACLPLTLASLVASLLPHCTRKGTLLTLALVNLVLFDLAFTISMTNNYSLHVELDGSLTFNSLLRDLIDNTHWRWVFGAAIASILASAAYVRYQPTVTRRNVGIALVVLSLLAAQAATATIGLNAVLHDIGFGQLAAGKQVARENCRAVLPGLVVCGYSIRPFQPQGQGAIERRYKDVYLWYGFGVVRIRHSLTAGT